ncbi:hypothetical protein V8G54_015328 [Vigna mungo]|uniref:Uncharacterized protein n=1 Tax=Vigna mungo TaxID=3915 RepID=A0AAQ3NKX4_VIGMU
MLPLWVFFFPTESISSLDPGSLCFLVSEGMSVASCNLTLQCSCRFCNTASFFEVESLSSLVLFRFPIITSLSKYKKDCKVSTVRNHVRELASTQISRISIYKKLESVFNINT